MRDRSNVETPTGADLECFSRPTGASEPTQPLHLDWINLHRGPAFSTWCDRLIEETDRWAAKTNDAGRERMRATFERAVDLELAFFESAYDA